MKFPEKQIQIMEVAEQLFALKGFTATSIRDIASAANINLAMISYYFGSKDKLIKFLFTNRIRTIGEALEEFLSELDKKPVEGLNQFLDKYIDIVARYPSFFKIMMVQELSPENEFIRDIIFDNKAKIHKLIKSIISKGQKEGVFKRKIDIQLVINTIVGTVYQTFVSEKYQKSIHNDQMITDEAFKKILTGKLKVHLKEIIYSYYIIKTT